MIKSYFLIAFRRLNEERIYAGITIVGLALGIACFLVLILFQRGEMTYDQHYVNHERIFRLTSHYSIRGSNSDMAVSSEGAGPLLTRDYPQLGNYVRFRRAYQNVLTFEDTTLEWYDAFLADENIFEVFDHKIIEGNPATALDDPYSIAISESVARSYFGDLPAVGKLLQGRDYSHRVSLVFADAPANTHMNYDLVFPYKFREILSPGYEKDYLQNLSNAQVITYLYTPADFNIALFNGIAEGFVDRYMSARLTELNASFHFALQPLSSIHYGDKLQYEDFPLGNIYYLIGSVAVAAFILLIACINYINLATARAMKRAREVGMRKVLGAERRQLISQFLGESVFFVVIAMIIAITMVMVAIPLANSGDLLGGNELLISFTEPSIWLWVVALGILVAVLSGLYPAFYLSRITPLEALTKERQAWTRGLSVRQLLILVQMIISIGVITCTLLMGKQIDYINNTPLGFNKNNLVWINLQGVETIERLPTIKNELLSHPEILDVIDMEWVPGFGNAGTLARMISDEGEMVLHQADVLMVGENYFEGLDIEILQGRGFDPDISTDFSNGVMVNETMARRMGWEEPVGQEITSRGESHRIIGVTSDFHYTPLHNEISPLVIHPLSNDFEQLTPTQRRLWRRNVLVVIDGSDVSGSLQTIKSVVENLDADQNIAPVLLEDRLEELYQSEQNLISLSKVFSVVCVLISAMGLFGLAAFTTEQRCREFGIRKVLGASSLQIVALATRHVTTVLLLAAVPASWVSFKVMDSWLGSFAYQTSIPWQPFLISISLVGAIAVFTVAVQSLAIARENPAQTLEG